MVIWFTGLSGAGKTTLAKGVLSALQGQGLNAVLLDGDAYRRRYHPALGYTEASRRENVRRIGRAACFLECRGRIVLVAAISPYAEGRQAVRERSCRFVEVFVDAPLSICENRDPKGLYRRFRSGEIRSITGADAPYEAPLAPEVHCRTAAERVDESVQRVLHALSGEFARRSTPLQQG